MLQKRQLRIKRELNRLTAEETLVACLNGDSADSRKTMGLSEEARQRVAKLLEMAQGAARLDLESQADECEEVLERINGDLCRYRWSPELKRNHRFPGLAVSYDYGEAFDDFLENMCVWWITELLRQQNIFRVRRCAECGRWFWAVRDHQKHCDENCRKKHATHSPVFKEKRRLYMVKYRRDEKTRSAAALARVRGNKRK